MNMNRINKFFILVAIIFISVGCNNWYQMTQGVVVKNDVKNVGKYDIPPAAPQVQTRVSDSVYLKVLGLKNENGQIFLYTVGVDQIKIKLFLGQKERIPMTIAFVKKNIGNLVEIRVGKGQMDNQEVFFVREMMFINQMVNPILESNNFKKK